MQSSRSDSKRIAVIGMGFLGKAMVDMLDAHCGVAGIDVDTVNGLKKTEAERLETANESDLAILCLPTPMDPARITEFPKADLSSIEWWVERLNVPILIKSTIPPGTTQRLRDKYGKKICFSPEFGGESTYHTSARYI